MSNQTFLRVEIPNHWAGRTLASFLLNQLNLSRKRIRILKKNNGIFINDAPTKVTHLLQGGEFLELIFPRPGQSIFPEALALSIIYEDDDFVVVDKPAGQVVHPVKEYQSGTLANALIQHWQQTDANSASFHPVHRLDRLTTGLVLIAKSPWIHQQMASQLENHHFHRLYLAICKGIPPDKSGRINLPMARLFRSQDSGTVTTILNELPSIAPGVKWTVDPMGKPAITRYRVLKRFSGCCLIALKLFTGRTHQIRVHLSHLGCPLWGDMLYGDPEPDFTRPALHAVRLNFIHPRTRQIIKLRADIPQDFHLLLAKLH
jgi:23S rRNA pseudouridine1911/1915/1917 synthase